MLILWLDYGGCSKWLLAQVLIQGTVVQVTRTLYAVQCCCLANAVQCCCLANAVHAVSPQCMQAHYKSQNGNKSDDLVRVLLLCGDLVAY